VPTPVVTSDMPTTTGTRDRPTTASESPTTATAEEVTTPSPSSSSTDTSNVPTPIFTTRHTSDGPTSESPTSQLPATSAGPTPLTTRAVITPLPTLKPTPSLTRQPTSSPTVLMASPTVQQFGSVEVSFEVGVTLEGVDISDLDITALDEVVNLLQTVFADMLPPGAIVRLLKVGGFSVTRRSLRFLEDDGLGGVDVEFEIIMTQACSSAKCDDLEAEEISQTLYEKVTSDFEEKVASGELTTSIQEKAESAGVSEMSNVTISASTLQVGQAKVTIKEAQEGNSPPDPTDDDDMSLSMHSRRAVFSALTGVVSIFLHI